MTSYKIAVLAGDGIGPEVVGMAVRVLKTISKKTGVGFEMEEAPVGGCACDATGNPLPEATLKLAKKSDAVLLGAVGGPNGKGLIILCVQKGLFWGCVLNWDSLLIYVQPLFFLHW